MKSILMVCAFSMSLGAFAQSELDQPGKAGNVADLPATVVLKIKEEDVIKKNQNAVVSVCHKDEVIAESNQKAKDLVANDKACFTDLKAQSKNEGQIQQKDGEVLNLAQRELDNYDSSASWYFYYYNYQYSYSFNNWYRPCYYYANTNYYYNFSYRYYYGGYYYYYYRW